MEINQYYYIKNHNLYFCYWFFIFISGYIGYCHYLRYFDGIWYKRNICIYKYIYDNE